MAAIQGFGGGLDVSSIVSQTMYAERIPITRLEEKERKFNSQAAAFRDLKSKLLALSSAAQSLGSIETASAKTAVASDTTVLTATGKSAAVAGSYSITVGQLATTDTFASTTFSSSDSTLLTGSFDLKVGDEAAITITIDSSNNTLTGLRDAINSSGAEVSASIVKDGDSYKLAIISKDSGTDNEIVLSNFSGAELQTQLSLARTVTLQDATLTINGISVTSSSNTVTDALQGVTLNLIKAGSSKVTVSPDSETITKSVNDFIEAFNGLNSFFNTQFKYDASKGTAGVLASDGTVRRIQSQLQQALSSTLSGMSTSLTNLREVGVNMANDGSLSLDSAELEEALQDNPTAVANLFQTTALFSDSRASLVATGSKTQAGSYALHVTAAAEAAEITGSAEIDPVDGLSDSGTVTITYKGTEYAVSLSSGQKIADIVLAINARLESEGVLVRASNSSGRLKISTQEYGSGESVSIRASAGISADLGISTSDQSDTGVDVAGTINGHAASGSGRTLLATDQSGSEYGLATVLNITPADVGAGLSMGTVTVTVGFSGLVKRIAADATTSSTGSIDSALNGLDSRTKDISDSISAMEERLARKQELLTAQLIKADSALKEMQTKMSSLSSQLSSLG
jgi:flagellar hook-associated protein 2